MRAAIFTLAILLTATGCPQETPHKPQPTQRQEDDPGWDCHTDGDKQCGTPKPTPTPTRPRRTAGYA